MSSLLVAGAAIILLFIGTGLIMFAMYRKTRPIDWYIGNMLALYLGPPIIIAVLIILSPLIGYVQLRYRYATH